MALSDFYRFNPSVKADSSNYVLGTYYYYSINENGLPPDTDADADTDSSSTPAAASTSKSSSREQPSSTRMPSSKTKASSTTNTATASTGVATPTPTQDGIVAGCTAFYYVVSGDGCWAIANDYGISLDDLYLWNPALNGDCTGLWPTNYICVSRSK
jgi:LysM repeat protein